MTRPQGAPAREGNEPRSLGRDTFRRRREILYIWNQRRDLTDSGSRLTAIYGRLGSPHAGDVDSVAMETHGSR